MLRDDARAPYSDVARALEISESRARRTATAMFASGLLRPRVEIEPRRLGYELEAILGIGCAPRASPRLGAAIATHPSTRFLALTGASTPLVYDGVFRDENDLADFVGGGFAGSDDVTAIECTLQLAVVKRYWRATTPPAAEFS